MFPGNPLKLLPLLTSCLLLALPAPDAEAHFRPTAGDVARMAKYELKSKMCRAKATTDHETPLMRAAGRGHTEVVRALIAAGADVNDVYGYGESSRTTALMEAALHDRAEVVRLLIEARAKLDLKDGDCETALMQASNPEVIGLLLKAGADWKTKNIEGKSALDQALEHSRTDVLRAFLDAGVKLSSSQRAMALSMAACQDMELVQKLLKAGAKLNDDTFLHAARCGQAEIVRFFLASNSKLNVNVRDSLENYGKTALMWAAERGHPEVVKALTQAGADVNAYALSLEAWDRVRYSGGKVKDADWTGETALMWAVSVMSRDVPPERKLDTVRALTSAGADVNARDDKGRTPLMVAALAPIPVVKALIQAGADLKAKDQEGRQAVEMVMRMMEQISAAGDVELVRELLQSGIDVNKEHYGAMEETALMLAVKGGSGAVVRLLTAAGADPNARNYIGLTAIMLAARGGQPEALKALIEAGANPKAVNENGSTLLMMALPSPDFLLTSEKVPAERRLEVVKTLIQAGLDVKAVNNDGETALHFAAAGGYLEPMQTLLAAGADVNARDKEGNTPLMYAACYGGAEAVRALIAAGAKVNVQSSSGKTPLMCAAQALNAGAVQALTSAGAEINAQNQKGEGALDLALAAETSGEQDEMKFDAVRALLKAGASVKAAGQYGQSLELIQAAEMGSEERAKAIIQAIGGKINSFDEKKMTPLMWAARFGQAEAVRMLIAAGAKVNISRNEKTALMLAARGGHAEVIRQLIAAGAVVKSSEQAMQQLDEKMDAEKFGSPEWIALAEEKRLLENADNALFEAIDNRHPEAVKVLLEAGANVNARGDDEQTPLMLAVKRNYPEMVKMLTSAKADVNAKNNKEQTALDVAQSDEIKEILRKAGAR